MSSPDERREALKSSYLEARECARCPQLAGTRTQVVFGAGNADADLMFVGEAPGAEEDKQGLPFVGRSGQLLNELLGEIGLKREDVFIANTLMCLRYDAQVQLGDGSWERIGRLVRTGYAGNVMSMAPDGTIVPKRVVGWHMTPRGDRRVLRLSYRSAKRAGANKVSIRLTEDHRVLTDRGYVAAGDLRPRDRIATGQGLSELARDVVCGSLLGDSSIARKSAALTCTHGAAQEQYARYKGLLLSELHPAVDVRRVAVANGGSSDVVLLRTRAHRALRFLRSEFYAERKRVPAWLADELTPRMLAFWFMDDGHLRRRSSRMPSAEIAAVAFSQADLRVLQQGLLRLGLPAKIHRGRLHFDVATTPRLSEAIAPFVPASMRYKLHPEVEARVPYQPQRNVVGAPVCVWDEAEVEVVDGGATATYFCLDVEDTHNFVTAAGVVHNCRPPGNRDPAPSELSNCESYLWEKLELIQPTVVCTLGNFATKLLRGDTTGITRLHGRAEVRTLGPRTVHLLPLFHPAAALYQRSNVEVLREDFAQIPALLAAGPPAQPMVAEIKAEPEPEPEPEPLPPPEPPASPPEPDQLGLF